MARARRARKRRKGFSIFDDEEEQAPEEELPKDEAGRRKIKRQYEELLGIRINKLAGRILNRERINKTIEGIYFICAACKRVCHNMDEGLVEDPNNLNNLCSACARERDKKDEGKKGRGKGKQAAA